jgi:hypothetical protein
MTVYPDHDKKRNQSILLGISLSLCLIVSVIGITVIISSDTGGIWPGDKKRIDHGKFVAGTTASFGRELCARDDYSVVYKRLLTNVNTNVSTSLTEKSIDVAKGCHRYHFNSKIPNDIIAGVYYIDTTILYKINPIKTVIWREPGGMIGITSDKKE